MRLEQLYFLIEVYRCQSISLASERAHISQPALSTSISKLESELGVPLLKRTNQGVFPTEIGEMIIQKAIKIAEIIEDIKEIAKMNSLDFCGDLSIAAEAGVNISLMPNVLVNFKKSFPRVNTFLKVGESNNILRDVNSGKADFGIIMKTEAFNKAKDIKYLELFTDELVVLAGKDCPISDNETTLKEALSFPIVLYNTEYVTDCGVSSILNKYGDFNVSFRIDNLPMLEKIISQGQTLVFVPRLMAKEYFKENRFKTVKIKDVKMEVSVILIWSSRHHLSYIEKEFIKILRKFCPENSPIKKESEKNS
ncbi:MAG: LysR family transcriptional regulator [Clostridia bacterium]|nr:LysR family transcriptional regulator [Clostridia bacterium]